MLIAKDCSQHRRTCSGSEGAVLFVERNDVQAMAGGGQPGDLRTRVGTQDNAPQAGEQVQKLLSTCLRKRCACWQFLEAL